eukprot:CAMPEP_0114577234 /NCGR_PEP_ID=MMETSP0125-20121206/1915_1 /TAXON_ID=485358 ORGANISM="Aristerostoma sp., Strain ATCC 50986" /NCGR_SAMPLE_ID=MMETSP0125 /ASSEMBLY_ACC=CAM_ASM_000245 /LENGTH=50 /DNA_ID=CAMNT_0001766383 /DNA_START=22 /DNA_END=174 /DNA_ORIENTATION=+
MRFSEIREIDGEDGDEEETKITCQVCQDVIAQDERYYGIPVFLSATNQIG